MLLRLHLIKAPPRPYSSDALRYEVRFRPLLAVDLPDRIPFERYRCYVEMKDELVRYYSGDFCHPDIAVLTF